MFSKTSEQKSANNPGLCIQHRKCIPPSYYDSQILVSEKVLAEQRGAKRVFSFYFFSSIKVYSQHWVHIRSINLLKPLWRPHQYDQLWFHPTLLLSLYFGKREVQSALYKLLCTPQSSSCIVQRFLLQAFILSASKRTFLGIWWK